MSCQTHHAAHLLPGFQKAFVWIRIQQAQQANLFTLGGQALGYFQRDESPKRIADQKIGTVWLSLLNSLQVKLRHVFDSFKRSVTSVGGQRLQTVNRATGLHIPDESK